MSSIRYTLDDLIDQIRDRLIVSCQALPDEPLFGSAIMARLAIAAELGGGSGIRANTPDDIAAIRVVTELPIIGLWKVEVPGYDVYITPKLQHALAIANAGADMIAIDATARPHPDGTLAEYIEAIKRDTKLPILADISTYDEAVAAFDAGADIVSTTMSGYTPYSPQLEGPDIDLVRKLADQMPVIAEGRIHTPEQARAALDAGALAVIVGGAITRPRQITERFVRALASAPEIAQ